MSSKSEQLAKGFALPKPTKRTQVTEVEAQQFEGAQPQAVSSRLRRSTRGERISAYIPPRLAEDLRVKCALERRSVSDAVTEALGAWLDR